MDPAEQSMLDVIVDNWPILASLAAGLATVGWALWKIYIHQEAKFLSQLEDPESRDHYHQEFNDLLSDNRFDYTSYLQSVLGKFDGFFGSHEFSVKSYELCLTWAFIYPIILGLLFWLISNQDISGFGLFSPIEEGYLWKSPLIFTLIASMIYRSCKYNNGHGFKSPIWLTVFGTTAVAGTVALAGAAAFAGAIAVAGSVVFAVAFPIALVGVVVGTVAVTVALVFAIVAAVAGTVAVSGIVAFAVAVASTVAVSGIVAFAVAVASVVAIPSASLIIYGRLPKDAHFFLFYPLYFTFLASFVLLFLQQHWIMINEQSFGILLFLVALPIINSALDFLSLGLTRKLLKTSLRASGHIKKAGYYLLDLAVALLSLLVLIFSLFLVIKAMEWAAGLSDLEQPTYDLGALWQRIESRSVWQTLLSPDGWIFMMIFSTFLPSLIHGLALGGFLLTITQPDSSKITRFVEATAPGTTLALKEKNEIAGYLARRSIANVVFPVIGVLLLAGVIVVLLNFFWNIEDIVKLLFGG